MAAPGQRPTGSLGRGIRAMGSASPSAESVEVAELVAHLPEAGWSKLTPLHLQISTWLSGLITSGKLPGGCRLPPERVLAKTVGVSRMTLRRALGALQAQGDLIPSIGSLGGSVVAETRQRVELGELSGLTHQLLLMGRTPSTRIVDASLVDAPPEPVREHLRLEDGSAYRVLRIRLADKVPVVYERSWFPADSFPDLLQQRLDGSMYSLMANVYDLPPAYGSQQLEARMAPAADARLLDLPPGTPVITIQRLAFSRSGRPVEYSEDDFVSSRLPIAVSGRIPPFWPVHATH